MLRCLSSGVAKLFDPRAEFVTVWPLEGRIQGEDNKRQAGIVVHSRKRGASIKYARFLAGRINWSAGGMQPADRSLATPALVGIFSGWYWL